MSLLGIELNDAGIALAGAEHVIAVSPGYAWLDGAATTYGEYAWQQFGRFPRRVQNRFWRELNEEPIKSSEFSGVTSADLVHDHFEDLLRQHNPGGDHLVVAVPPNWSRQQLGLFLGIAQELEAPIDALVDSAVAATRRPYRNANVIHVDVSLFDATLTRIEQDERAGVGVRETCPALGIMTLERLGVEFFASLFVDQTRFDPLHDAVTEQTLCINVYDWLGRLAREKNIDVQLETDSHSFSAQAQYDEYIARLGVGLEPFIQQLRGMLVADRPTAVQLHGLLMRFPGLSEVIAGLPRVHVFGLEIGAAAAGAVSRAAGFRSSSGHRLVQRLPWDRPAVELETAPAATDATPASAEQQPTHAVIGGLAYRLDGAGFQVGTQVPAGEYGLEVSDGHSGVSRRHCAIVARPGAVELVDHSRHGTKLNGHTIGGSAVLQAGDRISFGSPPVEILVIAEVQRDGS